MNAEDTRLIEESASYWLQINGGDADLAIKEFNQILDDPHTSDQSKQFAGRIRNRIREIVRPGVPKGRSRVDLEADVNRRLNPQGAQR